jgi:hypothetical protein
MAKLRVLPARGDAIGARDGRNLQAGDAEVPPAVREAGRTFAEQRARGATGCRVAPDRAAGCIDGFDPRAERSVVLPPVAGGRSEGVLGG